MKKLAKCTIVLMVLMAMAGSAYAYTADFHVKLAPENKGDLLFYPFYVAADGGWETKLWVINTSTTYSVVAKLVIRSWDKSWELLDFLIYLSPADVWNGILRYDALLGPVIYSTDGSVLVSIDPLQFASALNPMNQPLFDPICPDDSDDLGYVEIIESTSFDTRDWTAIVTKEVGENVDPTQGPVSKTYIKKVYDEILGSAPNDCIEEQDPFDGDCFGNLIGARNVLAGFMELGLPLLDLNSQIATTTMKDYVNQKKLDTSAETLIGDVAMNNLGEIETVLAKDLIAVPYYNTLDAFSFHIFNFPTKLTVFNQTPAAADFCICDNGRGPFWLPSLCSPPYFPKVYDLEENTPGTGSPFSGGGTTTFKLPYEVNFLVSFGFPFAEGWVNYHIGPTATGNYSTTFSTVGGDSITFMDTPVIPVFLHYRFNAFAMTYPAYTFGRVYVDDSPGCPNAASGTPPWDGYQVADWPSSVCN